MIARSNRWVIILLILSLIPRHQTAKDDIIKVDDPEFTTSNKTRAMVQLVRKCVSITNTPLAVSEKLDDKLMKYLHGSAISSITSLASSKLFVDDWYFASSKSKEWYCGQHNYRFLWKSSGFLIAASSVANLKEQLDTLQNSRWWNSAGFFILTRDESSIVVERCSDAYDFLSLAWRYNLLSSVFICQEQDGNISIYSYNPYGYSAPQPWLKNRQVKGLQGHPWNLFKIEKYDGRRHTCENVFFDKTTSLDGYPILTNALPIIPFLYFNRGESDMEKYNGEDGWIMKTIWKFLNASIMTVKLSDEDAKIGWVDDNGTFHGNLIDIYSGKVEIGMNSMILQPTWKVATTYPHTSVNICYMLKISGRIPWLIGLIMVFDKWTIICMVATFSIAIMIFGHFNKRRYFLGFLNVLRVVVSTSFIHPPSSTCLRMILCFLYLMPIICYSTLQGKILSLIRNPLKYADIDNFDDLNAAGYHVEGLETLKRLMPPGEMAMNFLPENDLNRCIEKLYKQNNVSCINYCFSLMVKSSAREGVYIGQDSSPYYQNRFIARPDWPLLQRFNDILQRMVDSGLTDIYRDFALFQKSPTLFKADSSDTEAVVIRLQDHRYVFIGLGIGWICATLAFIGELVIGRSKKREIPETRVMPRIQVLKTSHLSHRMQQL